jgi:hypothetical protein
MFSILINGEKKDGGNMKKAYNMIGGVPIWQHLKNGVEERSAKLVAKDYGKFAEILGERLLYKLIKKGGILDEMFPGIDIVSVQKSPRVMIFARLKVEVGDLALEISYRDSCSGMFGKKIVIFEIKHGKSPIEQNQLRRYCFMINSPEEYFHKADEVRIIFLMINRINTNKGSASYSMCELSKDLAMKILENSPVAPFDDIDNTENVDSFGNGDDVGDKIVNNVKDLITVDINISDGLKMIS